MASENAVLKIPGLSAVQVACHGCAERVCAAVRLVPGVEWAACDAASAEVSVRWDPELTGLDEIEAALAEAARAAAEGIAHAAYRLTGLD